MAVDGRSLPLIRRSSARSHCSRPRGARSGMLDGATDCRRRPRQAYWLGVSPDDWHLDDQTYRDAEHETQCRPFHSWTDCDCGSVRWRLFRRGAGRGGLVIDSGGCHPQGRDAHRRNRGPAKKGDLAIKGDRIVAVGSVPNDPDARVIDASGLVVAPGFIDLHTHSDEVILRSALRLNLNYLTQGVTTVVTGNCGSGPIDVAKYLGAVERAARAPTYPSGAAGLIAKRRHGRGRAPPSSDELDRMKTLVARGMGAGAWGMATGLIYVPSRYASTGELTELSPLVARYGGIYASHIRSEEEGLLDAVDEAIAIGKSAGLPVHISHLKASGKANWGKADAAVQHILDAPEGWPGRDGPPVSVHCLEHETGRHGCSSLGHPGLGRGLCTTGRQPRGAVPCSAPRSSASLTGEREGPPSGSPASPSGPAGWGETSSRSPGRREPLRWRSCSRSSGTAFARRSTSE